MANWTEEQYKEYMANRMRKPRSISRYKNPRKRFGIPNVNEIEDDNNADNPTGRNNRPKYRNSKVVVDGHTFDSTREATIYNGLKMSEEAGVISDLELQPRFLLQPTFKDRYGKTQRAITYFADFRYKEKDGNTVVVDVKSKITEANPVYRLKRKMLLYLFPEIDFREMY